VNSSLSTDDEERSSANSKTSSKSNEVESAPSIMAPANSLSTSDSVMASPKAKTSSRVKSVESAAARRSTVMLSSMLSLSATAVANSNTSSKVKSVSSKAAMRSVIKSLSIEDSATRPANSKTSSISNDES
jgi:hypothetical protein